MKDSAIQKWNNHYTVSSLKSKFHTTQGSLSSLQKKIPFKKLSDHIDDQPRLNASTDSSERLVDLHLLFKKRARKCEYTRGGLNRALLFKQKHRIGSLDEYEGVEDMWCALDGRSYN
ncbi:hypothetical protein [[Eubacterium] cellulosolvens]